MSRMRFVLSMVGLGLVLSVSSTDAQVRLGGQLSFADDASFGVGPRVVVGFHDLKDIASGLWLMGSFNLFFPDEDLYGEPGNADYYEINGNIVYEIVLPANPTVIPYVGTGLNLAKRSLTFTEPLPPGREIGESISETDLGLNILGGLNFPMRGVRPFVEFRGQCCKGPGQFIVASGLVLPVN